ncbi:MAG TPA: glycosyltransferase family 39 protein [Acidimicrobiales bacterium]|nr:glycosyltransferase family 39 protein [Acidimicrobiales bacterium]
MSTTIDFLDPLEEPVPPPQPPVPEGPEPSAPWHRWAAPASLAGVIAVALVLNCWHLSRNGLGNSYYAAATRSMTTSWRNFFFVAFDPGGFISVDKPPIALWTQALSARLFGFSSLSLLLPGALVGAASVGVLWSIVRRHFGVAAGTVAALALAVSPINVAVDRLNLPDPFMILFLLLAAWAVLRSLDDPRWVRWLVWAGAFVGLAFNSKMLAAAIPVPALALAVAVGSRAGWRQRIGRLALFGAAALAFSVPWMLAVDLTPASARPYVGGSTDNREANLVFGYNGLGRVNGQGQGGFGSRPGGAAGTARTPNGANPPNAANGSPRAGVFGGAAGQDQGGGAGPGGAAAGPGGVFGGSPGTLRLFSPAVGGQIAWLLPVAALGALVAAWRHRANPVLLAGVGLFAGWMVLHALVFSYSKGIFHSYYTSALAPGSAALVGIGGVAVADLARRHAGWLAVAVGGIVATVALQLTISRRTPVFHAWTRPVLVAAAAAVALAAAAAATRPAWRRRLVAVGLGVGFAGLALTPAAWATSETTAPSLNSTLPQAGPRQGAAGSTFGSEAQQFAGDPALAAFLRSQHGSERWDLVETSAQQASALVANQGLSVMALGGFSGSDPATTVAAVARLVEQGQVRFFLAGGAGVGGGGFGGGGLGRRAPAAGGANARPPVGRFPTGGAGGFRNGQATTPGAGSGFAPGSPGAAPGSARGGGGAAAAGAAGPGGRGTAGHIMSAVAAVCTPVTSASTAGALPARYDGQLYDCAGQGPALAARANP